VRWEDNVKNGVCGVQFDRPDIPMNKFVVTCLESQFHVYDARTQHPEKVSLPPSCAAPPAHPHARYTVYMLRKPCVWQHV
jgi:hypothetical protein